MRDADRAGRFATRLNLTDSWNYATRMAPRSVVAVMTWADEELCGTLTGGVT
jgi:hypothetical protein